MGAFDSLDILNLPDKKVTLEDMTFLVDYEDVTAVDPPVGTVFRRQSEVDDYLSEQGTTAFKHIQKVWEALPVFLQHNITINLAAGVHRPSSDVADSAFTLTGKVLISGSIEGSSTVGGLSILGASDEADWDEEISAQTVVAHQVVGTNPDYDPWVQVSGTPFPTDGSLKGLYALLDTGQKALIHDHTADTLYLMPELSPAPIDSTTTVKVGRPGTVLRNSIDDVNRKSSGRCLYTGIYPHIANAFVNLSDIRIEDFGTFGWLALGEEQWFGSNVMIDVAHQFDTFGKTTSRGIQANGPLLYIIGFSIRSRPGINMNSPLYIIRAQMSLQHSVLYGTRYQIAVIDDGSFYLYHTVLDDLGWAPYLGNDGTVKVFPKAVIGNQHLTSSFFRGKRTTFRAGTSTGPGLTIQSEAEDHFFSGQDLGIWFEGYSAPCVLLEAGNLSLTVQDEAILGFKDGGGNTDVGIEIVGAGKRLALDLGTDVSGALGDLRVEGLVAPYSELPTLAAPLVTQLLNVLSKEV